MDALTSRQQQLLSTPLELSEKLLILMTMRDADTLKEICELLGAERGTIMPTLGTMASKELVAHYRQDEEPGIRWHLTARGRTLGGELYEQTAKSLPTLEPLERAPAAETNSEAKRRRVLSDRRRVVMDTREPHGFSWE
jgi:DNA-binding MarR family transcriptional regulator